jgi:hypothetical protein
MCCHDPDRLLAEFGIAGGKLSFGDVEIILQTDARAPKPARRCRDLELVVRNTGMANERNNQPELASETSKRVMGEPPVWFINSLDAIIPGFARLLIETEFCTSYHRSGLDLKARNSS